MIVRVLGQAPVTLSADALDALADLAALDGDRGVGAATTLTELVEQGCAALAVRTTVDRSRGIASQERRLHAHVATITPLGRRIAHALTLPCAA